MRYNRLDATGAVTAAGSYAFLGAGSAPGAGGAGGAPGAPKVLTTWEDLRSEATTLRVHRSDAGGASRAAEFGAVAAGDIMEWRKAAGCWVRYRVTAAPARPASGSSRWEFPVERLAYAATGAGCTGAVPAASVLDVDVDSSAVIRSPEIVSPVRYGPYLLYPHGWRGALEQQRTVTLPDLPAAASPAPSWPSRNLAEVRRHPLWRTPTLPTGWNLVAAYAEDADTVELKYDDANGVPAADIHIYRRDHRPLHTGFRRSSGSNITEVRLINDRPAFLWYDPADTNYAAVVVTIYDEASGVLYGVTGNHPSYLSNHKAVIAVASSLLDE